MIQVSVKYVGPVFQGNYEKKIENAMVGTIARICNVAKETAIADYLSKRKSDSPKSIIVESFTYNIPFINALMVHGIVYAGVTPTGNAPWAIYVDQGHTLRNNTNWEGYNFMAAGELAGEEAAVGIAREEFQHLFK